MGYLQVGLGDLSVLGEHEHARERDRQTHRDREREGERESGERDREQERENSPHLTPHALVASVPQMLGNCLNQPSRSGTRNNQVVTFASHNLAICRRPPPQRIVEALV